MTTAEWAFGASVGSLCVSLAAFALQLRRWFDEGVKLSMSVMSEAQMIGGFDDDEERYIAITVTNRGSAATTITHMVLYNYPDRLSLFFSKCPRFVQRCFKKRRPQTFIVVNKAPLPLPHLLEPGRNWHGMARHTPELRKMIEDTRLYVGVIGSHSDKTFFRRVRKWTPPKDAKAA
ncbi:MAG: hypothetical protein JO305_04545 [Alphaproteobacteria bacterium]|nr:hypothetical protein [Alphaproteobacteria bacterium]